MAHRTSWTQSQLPECSVWSLPLSFSELVLDGNVDYSHLISFFARGYVPHPNGLRYIYVQMKDVDQVEKQRHLYLMATALDHILKTKFSEVDLLGRRPPLGDWNLEFALGIPNVGNCHKDKLWVLHWLQMEQYFILNPPGKKKNNIEDLSTKLRLDTALNLANDPFNMMEDEFMQRAIVDWNTRGTAASLQG
ncbi:hypothetical protein PIB30_033482 [Stylosanthes scabra]|uniref:Uncharacterized protein n=1 Tax=Stylosanthes scabra TaxID=79078 RepID=A0ABU6XAK5_9FABA|nr:hypothetical protein [Stylosanthes scabra]